MNITVTRLEGTPNSTPGMISIDGVWHGYTLEPRMDRTQGKPYAIPAGTYPVTLELSPKFGFITPHVNNVPGFSEIEIHPGNYPGDTHGCLLVGETRGADYVGNSRQAFADIAQILSTATDSLSITYIDYVGTPTITDPEIMM